MKTKTPRKNKLANTIAQTKKLEILRYCDIINYIIKLIMKQLKFIAIKMLRREKNGKQL